MRADVCCRYAIFFDFALRRAMPLRHAAAFAVDMPMRCCCREARALYATRHADAADGATRDYLIIFDAAADAAAVAAYDVSCRDADAFCLMPIFSDYYYYFR